MCQAEIPTKMDIHVIVTLLILCYFGTNQVSASVCSSGTTVGHTVSQHLNSFDTNTNRIFLIKDDSNLGRSFGEVGCYGVVESFSFRCAQLDTGRLSFQVWRVVGTLATLIGKHDRTVNCQTVGQVVTYDQFEWKHIPVKPGDRIAVQNLDGKGLVSMNTNNANCVTGRVTTYIPSLSVLVSSTYSLSGGSQYCIAFQAVLGPGKAPTFDNLPAPVSLHENTGSGVSVYQVRGSDINTITYTSGGISKNIYGDTVRYTMPDGLDRFTIDGTTGIITSSLTNGATFDYEALTTTKYYPLVVYAHDQATTTEGNSASATLTVSLVDINEEHAVPNLPATISVDAKATPGNTQVYQVNMSMIDGQVFGAFKYHLTANSQNDGAFQVDLNTGVVSTVVDMSSKASTTYVLSISVEDRTYLVSGDLTINILDANTAPTIVNPTKTVSVPENSAGKTDIFTLVATDPDSDTIVYGFSGSAPIQFGIDSSTGTVHFVQSPSFDYETLQTYTLTLSASDSVNTPVTTTLTVNIVDVNEKPSCTPDMYAATVAEGTAPNIQLIITDPDTLTAANRNFQFSILSGYGSSLFQTNTVAGNYFLTTSSAISLDRTRKSENYIIKIKVDDRSAAPFLTTVCTANVTVTQVNTAHTVTGLPATISVDAQATYAGDTVFNVVVTPTSIQAIDSFTYLLNSILPDDGTFLLDPATGQVNASLDLFNRTTPTSYTLSLSVTDRAGFTTAASTLAINIINTKSAPTIDNIASSLTINVPEDIFYKVNLFQIAASDADNDPIISYNIKTLLSTAADPGSYFNFDNIAGILYSADPPKFDAETTTTFTFIFNVNDYLHTSADKILIVNVVDVNEPPVFQTSYYTINMDEETPSTPPSGPTEVINLLQPNGFDATDPEDGNSVTYSILPSTYSNHFSLNPSGTSLLVTGRFDLDNGQLEYVLLEIAVHDQGNPALQDKAILNVTLNEINDNAAIMRGVPSGGYVGSVHENAAEGTSIFSLSATDIDPGNNGIFKFEIFDTDPTKQTIGNLYFQVDANGILSVKDQIDYETYKFVEFQVRAIDTYTPYWYTAASANITIIDVNDIRPTFVREFFNLEVRSDTDIGTHMATLLARDNDADLRGHVRYYFLQGDSYDYFTLNDDTGKITTHQKLQTDVKYSLYCFAEDRGSNKDTSTVAIVRVDSYSAPRHLIAITLDMSLNDYYSRADQFLAAFNTYLSPWIVKVESARETSTTTKRRKKRHTGSHTIVNIYALRDNLTDSVANVEVPKSFVHRDDILRLTRKTLKGQPTSPLLTGDFSNLAIVKVEPAYPIWWLDTIEGRVTIGILCLLFLALLASLVGILCCWRNKKCCFAPRKKPVRLNLNKTTKLPPVEDNEFKLKYKDPDQGHDNKSRYPRPNSNISRRSVTAARAPSHHNTARPAVPTSRPDTSSSSIHSRIYPTRKVNNFNSLNSNSALTPPAAAPARRGYGGYSGEQLTL